MDPTSTISDLQKTYADVVQFSEIDGSPEALQTARKKADGLGIGGLFDDAKGCLPDVLIMSADHKKYKEFVGPKSKHVYEDYLKQLLSKPAGSALLQNAKTKSSEIYSPVILRPGE